MAIISQQLWATGHSNFCDVAGSWSEILARNSFTVRCNCPQSNQWERVLLRKNFLLYNETCYLFLNWLPEKLACRSCITYGYFCWNLQRISILQSHAICLRVFDCRKIIACLPVRKLIRRFFFLLKHKKLREASGLVNSKEQRQQS